MRIFLLMLLWVFACKSATAEWIKLHGSAIQTTYADPAAMRISGSKIEMWLLSDYKKPNRYGGQTFRSVKSRNEYDCSKERLRMLSYSLYAGNMGEGEELYSDINPDMWKAVSPGSNDQISWKTACGSNVGVGWIKVGESDGMTGYANPFSIRRNSERASMWELFDFNSRQTHESGENYVSVKHQAEYDCEKNRYRTLSIVYHPENMGDGAPVFEDGKRKKWEPVMPGSVDEILWGIACKEQAN